MKALALILAFATLIPGVAVAQKPATEAPAAKTITRVVRLSVRVVGNGSDAHIELPLVQSDEHQTLLEEKLLTRGFQVREVMQDGNRLAILTYPGLKGRKRITYEFKVKLRKTSVPVPPAPVSAADPAPEDEPWLRPTLHLQSTSPLLREKLIRYATPLLAGGENDAIRIAWDLTRDGYERTPKGSKSVLKATRTGKANDRGLERLFATFLRSSGVPARPVLGVDVVKKKGQRFATWVEVKTDGNWVPMSPGRGDYGELSHRFVKLAHGDRPLVVRHGVEKLSFRWNITKARAGNPEASR